MNNEDKIKELERRIQELEKRPVYYPPIYYIPPSTPQPPYRCPICGSTGVCWHVTC